MSEPTYRVDLSFDAAKNPHFPHLARVVRLSDEEPMSTFIDITRDGAFDRAQAYVREIAAAVHEPPHSVLLSEDGDILDPHEVQR